MTGGEPLASSRARADPYRRGVRWLAVAGLGVYLITAIFNVGIVAIDDYFQVMARVVPAGAYTPDAGGGRHGRL